MPNESFSPKNSLSKDELQRRLDLLKDQLIIAKEKNSECANGSCGGFCNTMLCVKKVEGAISKITDEINKT